MVVLIDTNVIIDFLVEREPFSKSSTEIIQKCAAKEITGYIAFHTIPNLWYILRKVPENIRREWLADLCCFLYVTGASHEEVLNAIKNTEFKDFEDCLQDRCAKGVKAEYIVTRNTEDFIGSDVMAILPENLLNILNG